MSRDNSFIAVGYGSFVQVFCFQRSEIAWTTELNIKEFRSAEEVRFQNISFSPDGKFLAVVTQKYDKLKGREDDGVWTRVWMVREVSTEGTLYGFCFMPTDHLGVTAAFFDPQVNKVFVTGFIDTPYPLFHSASQDSIQRWGLRETEPFRPELLPTSASNPVSYKVRCAAQSPHPSHACFLTATNKLYRVNMKTESVEMCCDLGNQRARLGPREEAAALGMSLQGSIYVAWREAAKLYLIEIDSTGRLAKKEDLCELYEMAVERV
ncbi:uncharacterized protein PV09_01998 [Verruconis gallopava]|uniref:Minichromosome loss protein Mcl1 middle region domain-containing protein n=1 Tax=Verruconis gallopava TaxID=253628 RepID=A0A0D2AKN1_9PEZI|nr:uncharacterized protein PV09_01998 [Verruconis gallopava]KIW07125.1 hypothetical protein PV09_01998 [Verruconis gallopava]